MLARHLKLLPVAGVLLAAHAGFADVACPVEAPRRESVEYDAVWRTDAYSADYLMGNIQAAVMDDEGSLYLLDIQQQEVFRFSSNGEYLGSIVHQGEGPGEISQVWSMAWWSPGSLVLPQAFPPRVVRVAVDGTPQDALRVLLDPEDESPVSATEFAACGDYAVVGGSIFTFGGENPQIQKWLGVVGRDGSLRHKLDERSTTVSTNPLKQKYNEFEQFWRWDRWAVSQNGRLFIAPEREGYVIEEYDLDGQLKSTWSRPVEARERTKEELEQMRNSNTFVFNGQKAETEYTLADHEPQISDLYLFDDELWVRLDKDPKSESFARMAVHTLDGELLSERDLNVPHDSKNDIVLLLDGDHVAVIENGVAAQQSQFAAFGGEVDEELNAEAIEVVLYRVAE